jgi:hypothetical protein
MSSLVRTYTDSLGVQRTITMAFAYDATIGNFMRIAGVSNDLGMAWDKIVDDQMDGTEGELKYAADSSVPGTNAAWPSAETAPVAAAAAILSLDF